MLYFAYNFLLFFALLFYSPFYIIRQRKHKSCRPDLLQRLGFSPPKTPPKKDLRILIHAVSVGETRAVIPVIRELKVRCPAWEIYLTTTTGTGRRAAEQAGLGLDGIFYFPLDFGPVCAGFLRRVRPDLICLTETEIWPNFINAASRYKIPVCLINGRISDRSFKNYFLFKALIRPILKKFSCFCMQSSMDARRILALGAEPGRVSVTGNIKFDLGYMADGNREAQVLRNSFGLPESHPVIVAGSTHRGEEKEILDAFIKIFPTNTDLLLVLAPRHIERSEEIAQMIRAYGKKCIYWSNGIRGEKIKGGDVLLIDVIGVLAKIYSIATIVFIGGSLITHGGQNPLEPAFYGKPIIFGPHMENFRAISKKLLEKGAAMEINPGNLAKTMSELMKNAALRETMGKAGKETVNENQGAARLTCNRIIGLLGDYDVAV